MRTDHDPTPALDHDVVVVGGGPTGLSAAIGLGRLGVRTLLVERRATTSYHPRGHVVNGRSLEIFRSWGVAEEVLAAGLPRERNRGSAFVTRLAHPEFGALVTHGHSPEFDREVAGYAPHVKSSCPQDVLEPILLRAASALPAVDVRFGTTVLGVDDIDDADSADDAVTVRLSADGGPESQVRARFVIAADGAASPLRDQLGVRLEGPERLGAQMGIYFHADLSRYVADRPYLLWWVYNPETTGVLITLDGRHRWTYNFAYDPATTEPGSFTPERCVEIVRALVGDPDLDVDVRSARPWQMQARVATRMRVGNVFLAGDAAHPLPPTGGQGMNTGVGDVHNLAWKIAAVLRGRAGRRLLDTYEEERRPVARFNVDQSLANAERMARAGLGGMLENDLDFVARIETLDDAELEPVRAAIAEQREHFEYYGQVFGISYDSPGIRPDGTEPVPSPVGRYLPVGRPGARAPHLWLDPDHTRSLQDLFGAGFVLLTTATGKRRWTAPDEVDVVAVGAEARHAGVEDDFRAVYGIGADGAVLVRPDGHIAWRAPVFDPTIDLGDVLDHLLLRQPDLMEATA